MLMFIGDFFFYLWRFKKQNFLTCIHCKGNTPNLLVKKIKLTQLQSYLNMDVIFIFDYGQTSD